MPWEKYYNINIKQIRYDKRHKCLHSAARPHTTLRDMEDIIQFINSHTKVKVTLSNTFLGVFVGSLLWEVFFFLCLS